MNVQELEGVELDAAVAKAEGYRIEGDWVRCPNGSMVRTSGWAPRKYSTDWAIGGPIIERERIEIGFMGSEHGWQAAVNPEAQADWSLQWVDGPTPLIAAMRAYVAAATEAKPATVRCS